MRRSAMRSRGVMTLASLLVAAAAAGSCTGGRVEPARTISTAEHENDVAKRRSPQLGGTEGGGKPQTVRVHKTPELTGDIEALDEGTLLGYLDQLYWDLDARNNEIEDAECVHASSGDSPCLPGETARTLIQPEIGSFKWDYDDIAKLSHGLIVGRVINYDRSDRKVRGLGIPAETKAWWVVDRDPLAAGKLRSRYFRRTYSTTRPFVEQVGPTLGFIYCDHQHKFGHGKAIAKYVTCSQSLTMTPAGAESQQAMATPAAPARSLFHPAAFTSSVPVPPRPMVMALNATWITCDMGCCSTTP